MQGSQFPQSSYSVAEHYAAETMKLQDIHSQRALVAANGEEDVFGGYVRSFGFNYVPGSGTGTAQGTMWVEFSREKRVAIPVTVVILGMTSAHGKAGQRIVEKTTKLSEVSDLVLDAYFSTYCKKIERYVVVYQRFDGPFFQDGRPHPNFGNFFLDNGMYRLRPFWVEKIRSLMDLLELGTARSVTHGGLADPTSYVLSGGTLKLINVARGADYYDPQKDLTDLRKFIKTENYFNGGASNEWLTLDMLLGSGHVTNFTRGWKNDVVGHPMLLGPAEDIIAAFDGVYKSVQDLNLINKTKLANLLYAMFPDYRDNPSTIRNPQGPSAHHRNLRFFFPKNYLFDSLFSYTYGGVPVVYGGNIYIEMIRLSRNCIHHAAKYDGRLRVTEQMLGMMRSKFTNYISATYSLLHMLDDGGGNDGPYKSGADNKPTPSKPTFGDYLLSTAKRVVKTKRGGRSG